MANAIYPKWKTSIMKAEANSELDSAEGATGVYVALVDTGTYSYSAAHQFYSDLSGIVGTPQEITSKTVGVVAEGVFDGANVTFPTVSGSNAEALVIYRQNGGANTTWPLIAFIDTGVSGLPVTPNGGDITVTWNASGIFAL